MKRRALILVVLFLFFMLITCVFYSSSTMQKELDSITLEASETKGGFYDTEIIAAQEDVLVTAHPPRYFGDQSEHTFQEEVGSPNIVDSEKVKLIERLSKGIYEYKTRNGMIYYECGNAYEEIGAKKRSKLWAENIVRLCDKYSVNVWGTAGLIRLESNFDLCALGYHPRRAAYKAGILKPNKRSISHTYDEVVRVINNKKMNRMFRTFDLGGLQVLASFYKKGPKEDLLTWKGFEWQVKHLSDRGKFYKSKMPWAYWPGHYKQSKATRVKYSARLLGATVEELKQLSFRR